MNIRTAVVPGTTVDGRCTCQVICANYQHTNSFVLLAILLYTRYFVPDVSKYFGWPSSFDQSRIIDPSKLLDPSMHIDPSIHIDPSRPVFTEYYIFCMGSSKRAANRHVLVTDNLSTALRPADSFRLSGGLVCTFALARLRSDIHTYFVAAFRGFQWWR